MSLLRRASSKLRGRHKDPTLETSSNNRNKRSRSLFSSSARGNGGGSPSGHCTQSAPDLIAKLKAEALENTDSEDDEDGSYNNNLDGIRRVNTTDGIGKDATLIFYGKRTEDIAANLQPEYYDDAPELQRAKIRSRLFGSKRKNKSTSCLTEFAPMPDNIPMRTSSKKSNKRFGIFSRSNSMKRCRTPVPVFETSTSMNIFPRSSENSGLGIRTDRPESPKRNRFGFYRRSSHSADLLISGIPVFNNETGEYNILDLQPEYYDDAPELHNKRRSKSLSRSGSKRSARSSMSVDTLSTPIIVERVATPVVSRSASQRTTNTAKSVSFVDLQKSEGVEDQGKEGKAESSKILNAVSSNLESDSKPKDAAKKEEWKGKGILKKQSKTSRYQPYEGLRYGKAGSSILNPRSFDSLNFRPNPMNNTVEAEHDFVQERGRRYHGYKAYKRYFMPNDEQEQIRLNLQHFVLGEFQDGALYQAPVTSNVERVLDLGTGTGIWAIEMGHLFPNSRVWGIDLSPIQPTDPDIVPKNVMFSTGDIEDEWKYPHEFFDFIYCRNLSGAISDWPKLVKKALDYLKPGGYLEIFDIFLNLHCNPGTVDPHGTLIQWNTDLITYLRNANRSATFPPQAHTILKMLGFADIVCDVRKLPNGGWMKGMEEVGRKQKEIFDESIEALTLRLFVEYGGGRGMKESEVSKVIGDVRSCVRDEGLESWFDVYSVYGRKPYPKEVIGESGKEKVKSKSGKLKGKENDPDYNKYGEDDMLVGKKGGYCVSS